ncbi:hypothetical protein M0Q97_06730 [Candidatus Dojkabacteria bacterium]|jgi:hypothetical protein|nr:hypothetical protein [Candidatus Dojkabacteria bacterium]
MKIIEYSKYLTFVSKTLEISPLFESKGISKTIKVFTNIIYNKLQKNITEYIIDIDENDLKLKNLKIILENVNNFNYYGSSGYGDLKNDFLVNSDILLRFNFDNWNETEIKRIITHELLHIYEIYKRLMSNPKFVGLQWLLINKIQQIKDKYKNDDFIHDLCLMIYYTSNQELNAIVAQVYPILYNIDSDNKNTLYQELLKTKSYNILTIFKNFNYKNYKINYNLLIDFFGELNTEIEKKLNQDFIIFNVPKTKNDCIIILKKYQILFHKKSNYLEKKLNKIIDEVIIDVKNQKI